MLRFNELMSEVLFVILWQSCSQPYFLFCELVVFRIFFMQREICFKQFTELFFSYLFKYNTQCPIKKSQLVLKLI